MIKDLKQASKKNEAPIWSRLADLALKPSSRRVVNLARINTGTKENDILFVPSKVLGTGNISHKITLCSFSISTSAANKIIQNGGEIITYSDMIKKYPTGKGVYKQFLKIASINHPKHGPFHPRKPDTIISRMIRGMLPRDKPSGKAALSRLRVYIGVPKDVKPLGKIQLEKTKIRKSSALYTSVGELGRYVGWH